MDLCEHGHPEKFSRQLPGDGQHLLQKGFKGEPDTIFVFHLDRYSLFHYNFSTILFVCEGCGRGLVLMPQ